MVAPNETSPRTQISGTSGNLLIDAMLVTQESLSVPVAQRPTVNGTTVFRWGEADEVNVQITYSFFDNTSTFPENYFQQYINSIGTTASYVMTAFREAFLVWEKFVDVTFTELSETATSVGDIRIGTSLSNPNFPLNGFAMEAAPPSSPITSILGDVFLSEDVSLASTASFAPGGNRFMSALHEIAHAALNLTDVSTSAGYGAALLPGALNYNAQTIMSYSAVPGMSYSAVPGNTAGDGSSNYGNYSFAPTTPMILDIAAAQGIAQNTLGAGVDTLTNFENLTGSAFDDTLIGDTGDNVIAGGDGNDVVLGGNGADDLSGGGGADRLLIDRFDTAFNGGAGADTAYINDTGGATWNVLGTEIETWIGGVGGDTVTSAGGASAFSVFGLSGDDILTGSENSDLLVGGTGADILDGAGGNDRLAGAADIDRINGGAGNDILIGGADTMDFFVFTAGGDGDQIIDWQDGSDMLDFSEHGGVNSIADVTIVQNGNVGYVFYTPGYPGVIDDYVVIYGAFAGGNQITVDDFVFV